jgi:hypothetical protein
MEDNIPKKRGRKPKSDEVQTIKKKRGRKPTGKIIEIGNLSNYSKCIITHLPLTTVEISKIVGTNNNEKQPNTNDKIVQSIHVNMNDDNTKYCSNCLSLEKQCSELKTKLNDIKHTSYHNNPVDTGNHKQYLCKLDLVNTDNLKWGKKTDIACWWCCNKFDNLPLGLPEKYLDSKFYVQGCFCSFNCIQSYNLSLNDNKIWDRFSLLNYMKIKITNNDFTITTAPPRQALKMFGGPLSIDEFRKKCISLPLPENLSINTKEYNYNLPPIIPIYGLLDELPVENKKNTNKLKRNKPLLSLNNNLLQMMQ